MIVRITFEDGLVMLFGNSYKPWSLQFSEWNWISRSRNLKPIKVETSPAKWIGWGGLKWCDEDRFQLNLNREGCQEDELDNPRPRQYSKMQFKENTKALTTILNIIGEST